MRSCRPITHSLGLATPTTRTAGRLFSLAVLSRDRGKCSTGKLFDNIGCRQVGFCRTTSMSITFLHRGRRKALTRKVFDRETVRQCRVSSGRVLSDNFHVDHFPTKGTEESVRHGKCSTGTLFDNIGCR